MTENAYFPAALRDRALAVLDAFIPAATVVLDRVDPTPDAGTPVVAIYTPHEKGQLAGDTREPQFTTTISLQIEIRNEGADQVVVAKDRDALALAVREGLLGSVDFMATPITRVASYEIWSRVNGSAGKYVGEASIVLELEAAETFPPRLPDELDRLAITITPNPPPPTPPDPPEPVDVTVTVRPPG